MYKRSLFAFSCDSIWRGLTNKRTRKLTPEFEINSPFDFCIFLCIKIDENRKASL